MKRLVTCGRLICLLYAVSGCAGIIYETAWIRAWAISFGSTLLAFSTVLSVYLAGLAIGAAAGERFQKRRLLAWYGAAEISIALYALAVPLLMRQSTDLLVPLYASGGGAGLAVVRGLACAVILLPVTIAMGATLPWLARWLRETEGARRLTWVYAANTVGGAAGALLTGLWLLPALGYRGTVITASVLDIGVGLVALILARVATRHSGKPVQRDISHREQTSAVPILVIRAGAILSGCCTMLYEVAWNRIAGLLFGPTAVTVTLTLAMVLTGLAAGSVLASLIRKNEGSWFAFSQVVATILLLVSCSFVAIAPGWLAEQIRGASASPIRVEFLEAGVLFALLFPVSAAAGMTLPLAMRLVGRIGGLYGLNAAGCIAGALTTGWCFIPYLGLERTLYVGATLSGGAGIVLLVKSAGMSRRLATAGAFAGGIVALLLPRWDMAALTAGAYKYAPYYTQPVAKDLHQGEMVYLQEGRAGTVTLRRIDGSLVLAIDGKVDATDSGGDLLTEKLLAHLPLGLISRPRTVCVIGLASGVTAGAALTYPLDRLDVVELSPEVVQASHWFDGVNGRPLADRRTRLVVNDGRNHLALTERRYDAILSEPSNPWISGMNSLFTREFFRLAKRRLNPGGVLAQWFHLYNMPGDDLRSLLRTFTDVFPSATLWQLNDGDILLTGTADGRAPGIAPPLPARAAADLASLGVDHPALLTTLYVITGQDLLRFAESAKPNTDDRPLLEFHGLRNLNTQTDASNIEELAAFPKGSPPPAFVSAGWRSISPREWLERGLVFEKAESYRLAFASYRKALDTEADLTEALAGLMRSARTPEERSAAGTLESRTREALADAQAGEVASAERIFRALTLAYPQEPESQFNYGLFCLELGEPQQAIQHFEAAIALQNNYLPAFEAMAETYLREHDFGNAALWSRRILEIDPGHATARQTLATIGKLHGVPASVESKRWAAAN